MAKLSPFSVAVMALFLGLGGATAATVVETQRIIVDPGKAIAGAPIPVAPQSPEIHRSGDDQSLPAPVAAMRKRILDAAYSGDLEKLKALITSSKEPPAFSVNEIDDPIEYLKTQSGDGAGLEILALMTDVLEAGWTRVDAGTPQELYVWPYYANLPMDKLTPAQMVDVFKIVTSGDFEEMKTTGKYSFYALGISPDGTWRYFKPND